MAVGHLCPVIRPFSAWIIAWKWYIDLDLLSREAFACTGSEMTYDAWRTNYGSRNNGTS